MENTNEESENEYSNLNNVLKDFLSFFCHCCIENICNQALRSVYKLKIESEKMASCYLMFLREKILNTEIECKFSNRGCKERIMFGEFRHHLNECKFNKEDNLIDPEIVQDYCNSHSADFYSGNNLTIQSQSSSIININKKNINSNKKKKNKK